VTVSNDWAHMERTFATLGFREGAAVGEEAALQAAFNAGFAAGVKRGARQGEAMGVVCTLLDIFPAAAGPSALDAVCLERLQHLRLRLLSEESQPAQSAITAESTDRVASLLQQHDCSVAGPCSESGCCQRRDARPPAPCIDHDALGSDEIRSSLAAVDQDLHELLSTLGLSKTGTCGSISTSSRCLPAARDLSTACK